MADSDKRLKYYNGQFLRQEDFIEEQAYHLDRLRRHLRQLHTPGIAEGLTVTADVGDSEVTVQPGTAIDNEGRPIVLVAPRTVSVGTAVGKPVLVVITYRERPAVPATVGDEKDTRWLEDPEVEVIPESGAPPTDLHIRLARLHLDSESRIEAPQDTSVRTSAGTRLGTEVEIERVRLSRQGVAAHLWPVLSSGSPGQADVAGNLSVKGNVLVTGTVDGRDVSTDGQKLDQLMSATGILAVENPLSNTLQFVRDRNGNQSRLALGKDTHVGINTSTPGFMLTIHGNVQTAPLVEVHNQDNEASIRYVTLKGDSAWHVGLGGIGGEKNFFFWNDTKGAVATIEPDGTLTTKGRLNVGSGTKDTEVLKIQGDRPAPLVEVLNKREEALIRFLNNDNEAWHIGTGGLGGPKNFAFWNQTNGIVVTVMPDGSIVPRGTMYVGGGTKNKVAITAESDTPGPTVEVRNKQEESTIRYIDKNNVAWHVGTGGAGGAKNFFFWNSTNGAVATITPDGSTIMKGTLNVGESAKDKLVLTVEGDVNSSPLVEVRNKQNEASIRYFNLKDNLPWHVGTGGIGGEKNFFFWNETNGAVATVTPNGSVTAKGTLNAGGNTKDQVALTVEGDRESAPLVEVRNKHNEASIRYLNLKDNVAWHTGTGGGGGEKNFFVWNQTNGIVWTIEPSGAPTIKGIPVRTTAPDVNRLKPLLVDPVTGKIYRGE